MRQPESAYREVRAGDTLYSIAWESGRDYQDVAQWNGLAPPYIIKPGQRLRLYPPSSVAKPSAADASHRIVAKGDTLYSIAKSAGVSTQDLIAWNSLKPPYQLEPGQRLRVASPEASRIRRASKPAARAKSPTTEVDAVGPVEWKWPTEGTIVARFAPSDAAKGIDIAGSMGQAIHAAAPGKVVYQGSGLRGYGQLIIIKHNADFLSAYAHCSTIYVQEGSMIKPGQKIAAMGSSGTDRIKLHFEIRRRGVPVDPLDYLPKK